MYLLATVDCLPVVSSYGLHPPAPPNKLSVPCESVIVLSADSFQWLTLWETGKGSCWSTPECQHSTSL